ncbi:MAG: hypothetical protein KA801_18250 [Syntrophorhabdaceae bacterium]|nr:hypothetical protein [Syntrophorhabdaceae bacterium]
MKTTHFSHNVPWPGVHTAFRDIISLLIVLFTILLFFPPPSFSSVTATYEYNALNRLSVVGYDSALTETYTYDANGNRVSIAVSTGGERSMARKATGLRRRDSDPIPFLRKNMHRDG